MTIRYTPEQKEAIAHRDGNLLILACAGSGKTEVISRRIAMLRREGVSKNAIIAFTFTERAAGELKTRIRRHLEEELPDDPSLGDMYVGTIHSFCLQLLKEVDPSYRKFEVMDEARQAALLMTNFRRFEDSGKGIGLDALRMRTRTRRYWDTVRTFITTLNVIHQKDIDLSEEDDPQLYHAIGQYRAITLGPPNYFFDFDQIIDRLIAVLRQQPELLSGVRERFRYLVVDEYQDVDDRQEELIRLLSDTGRQMHVTVVGDDDQAIYGFRGARIGNILNFSESYPDVHTVTLAANFRSTHAIVDIANGAIEKISGGSRIEKEMVAREWRNKNGKDRLVEAMARPGEVQVRKFDSKLSEADWVAQRIKQLRGTIIRERNGEERAIDYADMAVLLRSVRASGREFAQALRQHQIPVVIKGMGGLFEHDEVRLIHATFSLLSRSQFAVVDEEGTLTILDEGETRDYTRELVRGLRQRKAMPHANPTRFLNWIGVKREELDRRNLTKENRGALGRRIYPQDIFQQMLETLGIAADKKPWPPEVLYNLGRLSQLITQFEAVHQWITPKNLPSLCMFFGGWAAGQVDEGGNDEMATPNAVQIMTVHAAKGLEWPVVFLPRVSSANFPSSLRRRGPETFLSKEIFDPTEYAAGDNGERRLWYVALTRCRRFLNVTSPECRGKKPSEYFKEIHHDLVQHDGEIPAHPKGTPTLASDVGLLPTTYTDLSYFWRCQFEYQLRALMGFGPGVKESYGYGQQIHNILAEVHQEAAKGNILSVDQILSLVDERFHLRYTRDSEDRTPLTTLRNAAKLSLERYFQTYPQRKFVLASEKPFEFVDPDSGALISGTVDLLETVKETPGGSQRTPIAIIDFKTHRFKDRASYERSKDEVETQLRLYAMAAHIALGFDAKKARAHFLSPKDVPEDLRTQGVRDRFIVDVSEEQQEIVRLRVGKAVRGIRKSLAQAECFSMTGPKTGHCQYCDYRKICPGGAEWRRIDRTTPTPPAHEEARLAELARIQEDLDARD